MKSILVPTDFSEVAFNALRYACSLARVSGADITLMNCYQLPASYSNILIDLGDILERDSREGLNKTLDRISREESCLGVHITSESYHGFLVEGIREVSEKYGVELVVMGTTGANGVVRKFFGSNTSQVLKRSNLPVLAIPATARWEGWQHTVFATDYIRNHAAQTYQDLMHLAEKIPLRLEILHVVTEQNPELNFHSYEDAFRKAIADPNVAFFYEQGKNIPEGILKYIQANPCDLLVMLRREHSLIEQIFNPSLTRSMTLTSPKPLLLLRE